MAEYTVAICNYNEAASVEASLRSVLTQVDERFEVLVVDDGSTDGSVSILKNLAEEYDQLTLLPLPPDRSRKLGTTRAISVEEAAGDHVILHVDTDNYYTDSIVDFTEIYEQLRDSLGEEFYLLGTSFAMTNRDFIIDFGSYRNLPVGGEDRDLWRRLAAANKLIVYEHEPVEEDEGWNYGRESRGLLAKIRRTFEVKTADFQVGFSFWGYLRWSIGRELPLIPYHVATTVISYLIALPRTSYETPETFRHKGKIDTYLREEALTLQEIEDEYGIEIDRNQISERGREPFDI